MYVRKSGEGKWVRSRLMPPRVCKCSLSGAPGARQLGESEFSRVKTEERQEEARCRSWWEREQGPGGVLCRDRGPDKRMLGLRLPAAADRNGGGA